MYRLHSVAIDKKVSFIIAYQFVVIGIKNVLVSAVPFLYGVNELLNLFLLGTVCIFYVYSIVLLRNRVIHLGMLFLFILVLLSILFTYLFFPNNIPFWEKEQLRFIIICFTSCFLISKLNTLEFFKKYMYIGSYCITVSLVVYAFVVQIIGHSVLNQHSTYSMSMANVAMLGIMWQLREVFKERSRIALLFATIGSIVLLLYGSRNQLLAIVSYFIIQVIGNSKYKVKALVFILTGVAFFAFFFREILTELVSLCNTFGVSSRTISLLFVGGIDESTQIRIDTHNSLRNILFNNPLVGLGISGDEANIGESAHSLYYSIWTTYGILGGTFFMIIVFYWCVRAFKKSKSISKDILVMYLCMVFPRSFTGGDIWGSDVFWMLLGICFMIIRSHKKECYQTRII